MMRLSREILIAALFLGQAMLLPAWAVLPAQEQKKWHEAYLGQVDIQAEIEYGRMAFEPQFFQNPRCVAYYTFGRVSRQPEGSHIKSGDELLLNYPCNNEGKWDWMGSTLPWAESRPDGSISAQLASSYLLPDGSGRWVLNNDPPVFAPVKPQSEQKAASAEDVRSIADINTADGIDRDEANVIAREFFHRYVSRCGFLGNAVQEGNAYAYPVFLGKKEKPGPDPLLVDKTTGMIWMKEFAAELEFTGLESQPPLAELLKTCESSGAGDILAWERWLQRERDVQVYCSPTDYYFLPAQEEDYPPEVRTLADHQKFSFCKYGNPATIFGFVTDDRSAKQEACTSEHLQVFSGKAFDLQQLPESPDLDEPHRRFKIVSPHFAAVVYTTVYDLDRYEYWVDRSYEVLRQLERGAVDCLCPADCAGGNFTKNDQREGT